MCPDCCDQFFLRYILIGESSKYILVHSVFGYDVVDRDSVLLSLPPQSSVGLLIQLQAPCQPKPDHDVTAGLNIESVSCGCRVYQGYWDVSGIPVRNICTVLYISWSISTGRQMLDDTGTVMLKPVADQHRLSVCGFYQIFEHFELSLMDDASFLVFIIDGAVRHLQQLV